MTAKILSRACLAMCWLMVLITLRIQAADDQASVINRILAAAKEQKALTAKKSLYWEVECTAPDGFKVYVSLLESRKKSRWEFGVMRDHEIKGILRIIERDGYWYVTEEQNTKCLPYRANLPMPDTYRMLIRSDSLYVDPGEFNGLSYEGTTNSLATFRAPPSGWQKEQQRAALAQKLFDAPRTNTPGSSAALDSKPLEIELKPLWEKTRLEQRQEIVNTFREAGQKQKEASKSSPQLEPSPTTRTEKTLLGLRFSCDVTTGIVKERPLGYWQMETRRIQWLDRVKEEAFQVENRDWIDHSQPPKNKELSNCIMACFDPLAKRPTSGYLLNVVSGEMHRLPYPGANAIGLCFLKNRQEIILTGTTSHPEKPSLFRLNLSTGKIKPVGGNKFENASCSALSLSPDGKTIAIHRMEDNGGQVYLIDLATDKTTPMGTNIYAAALNWTPDGKSLIVGRVAGKTFLSGTPTICRMDLNGTLQTLRIGEQPRVLQKQNKILYLDCLSENWMTCELDGTQPEIFADGLRGFTQPAVSPDEQHILFLKTAKGREWVGEPWIFNFGQSNGRPVSSTKGAWFSPVWR